MQFTFENKIYTFLVADARVREFLDQLASYQRKQAQRDSSFSLIPFREDFRRIIRHASIAGLIWCIVHRRDGIRQIAIWLLGRIHRRDTVRVIQWSQADANPQVRKEVAKALRRLGAWRQLRSMGDDSHLAVRRIVDDRPAKPFRARLSRFLDDDVQPCSTASPQSKTCYDLASVKLIGCPPRTAAYIREILLRIREFVHYQEPCDRTGWWRRRKRAKPKRMSK